MPYLRVVLVSHIPLRRAMSYKMEMLLYNQRSHTHLHEKQEALKMQVFTPSNPFLAYSIMSISVATGTSSVPFSLTPQ